MKRVLLAMSGGVDSSTSALLLKEKGYEVIGLTMKLVEDTPVQDAMEVAQYLGIPHHILDLSSQFRKYVLQPFVEGYMQGITPNPCVLCNREIKFGLLWEKAKELGADFLATGHYARMGEEGGKLVIKKGRSRKEQSYFLYNIRREILPHLLFPLGDLEKEEVRKIAEKAGLPVAHKEESKDLCFIKGGDYRGWLKKVCPSAFQEGEIRDLNGRTLGKHKGIGYYTIGQREGLGVALGRKAYVREIRAEERVVVVGEEEDIKAKVLWAKDLNWLVDPPEDALEVGAKIRYLSPDHPARLFWEGEEIIRVEFQEEVKAPALGQSVVFYKGDILLGGGIICRVSWKR